MKRTRVSRVVRDAALILAILGGAWGGWLLIFGGFDTVVLGVRVRSNDPLRPLVLAGAAFGLFTWLGGRIRRPAPQFLSGETRLGRVLGGLLRWRPSERGHVLALSLAVATFGILYATTVAGGSDSYGYVSQADLWRDGDLRIEQPWVAEATWPSGPWSFAPLGYRTRADLHAIVPTYSPGLPLLMAGAKTIAGQEGVFWVVPLLGGVLVLATYGVARRVAPPGAAIMAAWLIATCPVMIHMLVLPMSDVPVAALWMCACYGVLRPGLRFAAAAGVAAAIAVLVRPNLVFMVAILAVWPLWQAVRCREGRGRALWQTVLFGGIAALGAVAVALINQYLYGSPSESGYGDISAMFDRSHLWPNLVKYTTWLIQSQTIAAAAGGLALVVPWRRIWPDPDHRRFLLISASIVASVWVLYCLYLEYDVWWFLRFMLPALPFVAIGTAAVAMAIGGAGGRTTKALLTIGVVVVVIAQGRFAVDHGVLGHWRGERRYVRVGHLVRAEIGEQSVVISNQHSGSLRYYGGRMTLRFENLDGDALDAAVAWLSSRGLHPYLLVEDWEIPMVRERFAGQATLARLETPRLIYRGPATVMLFDLAGSEGKLREVTDAADGLRSVSPAPPAQIQLR